VYRARPGRTCPARAALTRYALEIHNVTCGFVGAGPSAAVRPERRDRAAAATWSARHPLVEPLAAALIEALLAGPGERPKRSTLSLPRAAAARRPRHRSPGPALRAATRGNPARPPVRGPPSPIATAQLPPAWPASTVRTAELAALDLGLGPVRGGSGDRGGHRGRPGRGRRSARPRLGVHWAHLRADRFPDGTPRRPAGESDLRLPFQTASRHCPASDSPSSRVRIPSYSRPSGVALKPGPDRRRPGLVVLDNAASAAQVRPLTTAGHSCSIAVVTSRDS